MRFALASDLHNEFFKTGEIPDLTVVDADYLVLAGDIETTKSHDNDWLDKTAANYKAVFYIPGNHEYYKTYFNDYPILYFPDNVVTAGFGKENSVFTHLGDTLLVGDGVSVLMGTMWSDLSDPHASATAKNLMNDYRQIKYGRDRHWFTPQDTTHEYNKFITRLKSVKPDVVISHHAPSLQSVNLDRYKDAGKINMAYYSNVDMRGVKLWMHGHTHYPVDYVQYDCRVVSNPRGYPGEIPGFSMKVFEI